MGYNIVAEIDRLDFPVGLIGINQSSYAVKFLTRIEARRARGGLITIAHDECIFCASSQNMHHDRKYFLSIYSIEGPSSQGKTACRNKVFTLVEVMFLSNELDKVWASAVVLHSSFQRGKQNIFGINATQPLINN